MRSVREELDQATAMGDVAAAVRTGRRRQLRRRGVVAMSAAAVVAAGVVLAVTLTGGERTPGPAAPAGQDTNGAPVPPRDAVIGVDDAVRAWVPAVDLVGTPIESGSVVARQCPSVGTCQWTFLSPGGAQVAVETVSPDLAALLADAKPNQVSMSYDGQWMAVDLGGTVRVQALDPQQSRTVPTVLEPSEEGTDWNVVGWGSGSLSLALAEVDASGRTVGYATVNLRGGGVDVVDAPEPDTYGPVGDGGHGVQVSARAPLGARSTSYESLLVPTSAKASLPMDEVTPLGDPIDVSKLLRQGETLSGPNGLLEVGTPPDVSPDEIWPQAAVFSQDGERSGIIELRAGSPVRAAVERAPGWQIVGSDRTGQVIETSTTDGTSRLRARTDEGQVWLQQLPGMVDWVVPGIVIPASQPR